MPYIFCTWLSIFQKSDIHRDFFSHATLHGTTPFMTRVFTKVISEDFHSGCTVLHGLLYFGFSLQLNFQFMPKKQVISEKIQHLSHTIDRSIFIEKKTVVVAFYQNAT